MDYFDPDYFDPTYFDTPSGPVVTGGHGGRGGPMVVLPPDPLLADDEEFLEWIV